MDIIYGSYIYDDEIKDVMEIINKDDSEYFYADDYYNSAFEANEYIKNFFPNNIIRFYPKSQMNDDPEEPLWVIGHHINTYDQVFSINDEGEECEEDLLDLNLKVKIYNDYKEICDYFLVKKSKKLYYFSVKK
jgi:hypothetical protein